MIHTKRFYLFEEVRAAFLFCLKTNRYTESAFWLSELEDSYYGKESRRLLLISWAMNIGMARIDWYLEWVKHSETREGRFRLCWQLLRCSERDSSIWWLLCSGLASIEPGYSNIVDDWNNTCHLDIDEKYTELKKNMEKYEIIAKVIAFVLERKSLSPLKELSNSEPIDLQKSVDEWNTFTTHSRRIYEIPFGCLYGMTLRGSGQDTTDEINGDVLNTSVYWTRLKKNRVFNDDDKEEFYDTHFPTDIPDEWSLKEKQKSHGKGIIFNAYPLSKWWNNWISNEHSLLWGHVLRSIKKWVETQTANNILDTICMLYSEREIKNVPKKPKVFRVCP